jgi:hypothetical protein
MESSKDTKSGKLPGLTLRVLLLVLLLAPVNAYILVEMEVVRYTYPSWIVPLAYVVFTLMVVVILNYLIRRMAPRYMLIDALGTRRLGTQNLTACLPGVLAQDIEADPD